MRRRSDAGSAIRDQSELSARNLALHLLSGCASKLTTRTLRSDAGLPISNFQALPPTTRLRGKHALRNLATKRFHQAGNQRCRFLFARCIGHKRLFTNASDLCALLVLQKRQTMRFARVTCGRPSGSKGGLRFGNQRTRTVGRLCIRGPLAAPLTGLRARCCHRLPKPLLRLHKLCCSALKAHTRALGVLAQHNYDHAASTASCFLRATWTRARDFGFSRGDARRGPADFRRRSYFCNWH